MKVILLSDTPELLGDVIEKEGHAIVAVTNSVAQLLPLLAEHRPHFVMAEIGKHVEDDLANLAVIFSSTRFVILGFERGRSWPKTIRKALRSQRINVPWPTVPPDRRDIILDPRYYGFCTGQKHKRPTEQMDDEAAVEASRLLWMLRAAREFGPRAENYRQAASQVLAFEWQELIFQTLHGSYKSAAFARDLLGRSLGYLSHFVPGIDHDGLPPPVDEPPTIRYLHYDCPDEIRYAIFGLALFGFDEKVGGHLYHAAQWRFGADNANDVVFSGLVMTGLAFTLHRVCWAHSTSLTWLLDPETPYRIESKRPRALKRALQTFADWWAFRLVLNDRPLLASVLEQLHATAETVPLPKDLEIPNYAAFLKASAEFTNQKTQKP